MFKRKKLNFFVAMIMVMTLMFGSTMCLAAEKNDVSENRNESIQARTQSMSGVYKFTDNNTGIDIYVRLYWAWDEGYTGYFRDAELVNLTSGELAGFSFSKTGIVAILLLMYLINMVASFIQHHSNITLTNTVQCIKVEFNSAYYRGQFPCPLYCY